jgi:hypothetical protein
VLIVAGGLLVLAVPLIACAVTRAGSARSCVSFHLWTASLRNGERVLGWRVARNLSAPVVVFGSILLVAGALGGFGHERASRQDSAGVSLDTLLAFYAAMFMRQFISARAIIFLLPPVPAMAAAWRGCGRAGA